MPKIVNSKRKDKKQGIRKKKQKRLEIIRKRIIVIPIYWINRFSYEKRPDLIKVNKMYVITGKQRKEDVNKDKIRYVLKTSKTLMNIKSKL